MNETNKALDSEILIDEITLKKEQVAEIDKAIEEIKAQAELAKAIVDLRNDEKYIKVIENAYFKSEGERISKCLLDPTPLKRDQIENMMEMMSAIRILKTFLLHREHDGSNSEERIQELNDYRTQVLSN